jgi:predicted permease
MSLRRFFHRAKWDRERLEEIESYVRIETDESIARGMPVEEAREAARRKFGNRTLVREEIYKMNTIRILDTLARNMRYSVRAMRRNPMFTAVALLTLAIGIGANTAVFSVVNSVLLKPLPYPKAEELVGIWQTAPGAPGVSNVSGDLRMSPSMYVTYAEQNRTFQSFGAYFAATSTVTGIADPEEVRTLIVTEGTLEALAVQPVLGRWFTHAEQQPGTQAVMLGYGYWQRRFGGDKSVIGKRLTLESRTREIIGVMPQGFRVVTTDPELIIPTAFNRNQLILAGFAYGGVARLKPGVTIAEASADMARMVPIWMNSWTNGPGFDPHVYEAWKIAPALRPLKQDVIGNVRDVLWVLMGTIGIVMLIACANVANLLLVRAEGRQQELAVRAALGAGWRRIVRELLFESLMLGLMGGMLGLGLAYFGLKFLVTLAPASLPRLNEIGIDPRALAFTLGVSLFSGLLFGVIPSLKYGGPRVSLSLREGARGLSHGRERHRARNVLVVMQTAFALVLLVSSGLMVRTFQALRHVEPGFTEPEHLQTVRIAFSFNLFPQPERVARAQNQILDKLAALPGVTSVGFARAMPMEGIVGDWSSIQAEDRPAIGGDSPPMRVFKGVSPGVFRTTGTRLLAGRDYTWADLYEHRPQVMLSENLARELWGSPEAAIGKRVRTSPVVPWREVIGVVQDVHENGVHEAAPAIVYWPSLVEGQYQPSLVGAVRFVTVAIRSARTGTESFSDEIRQAVWSVEPRLAVASIQTMREIYDQSMARSSFTLVMLGIAGVMALVLGIIGIYGVIAYAVSQRRREIGIRLALGAQPADLKRMFVRYALVLAGNGVVIGLGAAMGLTRLMSSLLFGISPLDPLTYGAVPVVLIAAAVLASYLPARRVSAVDPVEALKAE